MVSLNKTSVSVSDDYLILMVCTTLANLTPIWHLFVFFVLHFVYLASINCQLESSLQAANKVGLKLLHLILDQRVEPFRKSEQIQS
jgi:hypothetical protein